jgi:iron complex transport system permease protein
MGDLDVAGYGPILAAPPLVAIAFIAPAAGATAEPAQHRRQAAGTRGVNVVTAQRTAFSPRRWSPARPCRLVVNWLCGDHRPASGPTGRGADHRLVLPASTLFGAAFLVACDVIARTVFAPIELPVGIITAIIGGPFFLWMLIRNR